MTNSENKHQQNVQDIAVYIWENDALPRQATINSWNRSIFVSNERL